MCTVLDVRKHGNDHQNYTLVFIQPCYNFVFQTCIKKYEVFQLWTSHELIGFRQACSFGRGVQVCIVCVCVCETGGCPTVVSPVYSRKSWTSGTTIVTGSSPDTDGFAFPPLATLHLCLHLTHCDTCDTHKHARTHKTDQPHLA